MAVTVVASGFVGAPEGEGTNSTSHGPLVLPTVADGDWLVAAVTIAGGSTTVHATGAGWASQPAHTIASRSGYATHGFVRQLTAGDSSAAVTFTTSSSLKAATAWMVLRGLKPGHTPVYPTPVTGLAANPMTPPPFTPTVGKVLVHLVGIATGSAAPPSVGGWTTPTGMALVAAATMGGTTGRAGGAIGAQLTDNAPVSGEWDSDASSSWGIAPIELEVADDTPIPVPATVHVGAASFDWQDPAEADTLHTPAPTLTTTIGSAPTIPGATLIPPDDARFLYRGAAGFAYGSGTPDSACYQPSSRYPNGWGNPAVFGVAFQHTGTEFELLFKWLSAAGAGWLRLSVDGQRVTDVMYDIPGATGGSMHTTKVTFPSSATRRILLEFQGVPFAGVYVGAGDTVTTPAPFTRRVIVQGDSVSAGSDGNTGGSAGTWVARWARYAGERVDVWNQAIGGTGFTAAGTAVPIPARLTDVTAHAPDDVIVWCGGNDGNTSIVAEATQWIEDVKAAVPGVRVIVVGTWAPTVVPSTARANRSLDLKAAAALTGCPFISPITGEVFDADGSLVEAQGPWIATTGDVAAYVSGDGVHPNDAGHAYIAERMMLAMQALAGPIPVTVAATAPTVAGAASVPVPATSGTVTVLAPSVTAAASVPAPVASSTVAVFAPTVRQGGTITAPTVTATATGHAPTVTGGATVHATTAGSGVTAYAPTVTAGDSTTVAPPTVTATLAATAPTVTAGATPAVLTATAVVTVNAPHVTTGDRKPAPAVRTLTISTPTRDLTVTAPARTLEWRTP